MATRVTFPLPKDPADNAWYAIRFAEPLSSIVSSAVALQPTVRPPLTIGWQTPGDQIIGSPLVVLASQVATDTMGVLVQLSGGVPGASYAVRVGVITQAGSTLYRSAILEVSGL